jgi:nucleolar complex protein 2
MLLEVLGWAELGRRPAPGGGPLPNLGLQLRVSKRLLRSATLQEEVVASVMEMLAGHLGQWANHAAFPELSNTTAVFLRRFIKGCAVERFRRGAKQVRRRATSPSPPKKFIMKNIYM